MFYLKAALRNIHQLKYNVNNWAGIWNCVGDSSSQQLHLTEFYMNMKRIYLKIMYVYLGVTCVGFS